MRSIIVLVAGLAALVSQHAGLAQETEPFQTRNLSPPIAIFGMPAWESVTDEQVFTATVEVANHYRLSRRGPDTLIIDGETLRTTLFYSHPIGTQWSFSAELPVLQQTGGVLDDLIDGWHSAFGLPDGGRNNRPEDDLLFQLARDGRAFFTLDDDRRGIGDLQLSLARRFGRDGGFLARAAAKIPTGREGMLAGSGSGDWSITLLRPRPAMLRGRAAGYFWGVGWLDLGAPKVVAFPVEEGSLIGIVGGGLKVLPRFGIKAQIDVYSAMYDTPLEELGQNAAQITIGGWRDMGARGRIEFAISEDLHVSTAPDVVLHFAMRWTWQ